MPPDDYVPGTKSADEAPTSFVVEAHVQREGSYSPYPVDTFSDLK